MFEISSTQLCQLNDADLRELVARLCQAELGRAEAPVSAVRWGGSQTAPDGGLDVEVRVKGQEFTGDFVPRAWTGIQVKKSSMPDGKIANEMSPQGVLRPIFPELARHNGCYIIVSLADDPAGTKLGDREKAMQAQVESTQDQGDLRVEFYGLGRLADWLRQHPGVQLWVRDKLGLPSSGWKPFGRWSTTPPDAEDGLICKEGVVIRLPGREQDKLDIPQGIDGIRELVSNSGKAVRIVGLSGVGKSRIVQALFEESVGKEPLDRHLAIYADLGETPNPSAREIVERLTAEGRPAILVLDNCPSDAHSQIAKQVAASPNLRLITIEFDIREDKPETTSVVRIDAEGPNIAEVLIERRFPDLGQVNTRRIAEISDGNARVALALAEVASEVKESLSSFSDEQLFDRLFYQRGERDSDLAMSAEILSLVYSFSVGRDEEGVDELAMLATLLDQGRNRRLLYRAAQTLVDRQLAQERGNWRAILPHAVSNRLAAKALENIPVDDILNAFQGLPSPRLLKSFGRRLGYLHDHEVAQDIVKCWLSPGGRLHDLSQLSDDDIRLLQNVAPVIPEDVLTVMESQGEPFFSRDNPHFSIFVGLLVKIGYDSDLFERCVRLLVRFALTEEEGENWDSIRSRLFGLFSLYLSGTHAGPEAREGLARRYLSSTKSNKQHLGLGMLKAALRNNHWSSTGTFEFGVRPRNFGYQPGTHEERNGWFKRFIALAQEIAVGGNVDLSTEVRRILADNLRSLWRCPGLRATLMDMAKALNNQQPWLEGWRAVRLIKRYDYRKADGETILDGTEMLDELDAALNPRRLSDEVRAYVLSVQDQVWALDEELDLNDNQKWQKARDRTAERGHLLGTVVAGEPHVIDELSQELFTALSYEHLVEFGRGMASACSDLRALWDRLVECLEIAGDGARQCGVLEGILGVIHDRDESLAQEILDESVQNCVLRKFLVGLQRSVPLGSTGLERLHRALDFDDTPLWQFGCLAWRRRSDALDETDIRDLMLKILDRPDGAEIVLQGLAIRQHALKDDDLTLNSDLKRLGLLASAVLLSQDVDSFRGDVTSHYLSEILTSCLDEAEFPQETDRVIDVLIKQLTASYGYVYGLEDAVTVVAEKVTPQFLDGVFFNSTLSADHRQEVFSEQRDEKNLLSGVPSEKLLAWCRRGDFQERLSMLSEAVCPFEKEPDGDGVVLSEQTHAIIEAAQEPSAVLRKLCSSVCPSGWSGSRADIIAERRQAFETLLEHERSEIRIAAGTQIAEIKGWEVQERTT